MLSPPAIPMIIGLTGDDPEIYHHLLHPTGQCAARFVIIAMMITPLALLTAYRIYWNLKRRSAAAWPRSAKAPAERSPAQNPADLSRG